MAGVGLRGERKEEVADARSMRSRYDEFNAAYGFRKIDPRYIYAAAGLLSLAWAGVIWYYVENSIYSMASLLKMLPHEFGGFLAGTILPVGFVWMVALYIDRNMNSNYEKEVIYPFLQGMIDPHGDTSVITDVIRKKLSVESEALGEALAALAAGSEKFRDMAEAANSSALGVVSAMRSHEDAIRSALVHMDKSADVADTKAKGMLRSISENVDLLMEATGTAEKRAASIGRNMGEGAALLEKSATKASALADAMVGAMKASELKASGIAATAEALEARADQILSKIDDKTGAFVIKANISAEKIAGALSSMDSSVESFAKASADNRKLANEAIDSISESARFISERLAEHTSEFGNRSDAVLSLASEIEGRFAAVGAGIGGVSDALVAKFREVAAEKEGFEKSASGIRDVASGAAAALRDSSVEMAAASGNIRAAVEEVRGVMADSSGTLERQAGTAMRFASELKAALKKQTDDLEEAANAVEKHTRLGEFSIEEEARKLSEITEGIFVKIDAMNGKVAAAANGIMGLAERLDDRFRAMSEAVAAKSAAASKVISDAVDRAGAEAEGFRGASETFAEGARRAGAEIGGLLDALKSRSLSLGTTTKEARDLVGAISSEVIKAARAMPGLKETGAAIEAAVGLAAAKSDEIVARLESVGAKFSKFAETKASEMEFVANSGTQAITNLAAYADKLVREARGAIGEFSRQYGELARIAETAGAKLAAAPVARPAASAAATEEFLNRAGYMIEKLHSISIDLAQVLTPDISQDLWNKYNAGHRAIFSRHLAQTLSKKQVSALRDLVKSNPNFRARAKAFADEFDSLVLRARAADKGEVLLATITSTEIGKVYIILKDVL